MAGKATNYINRPITVWFIGLTLGYGIGAGAYGLELTSRSVEEAQHWIDIEVTFSAFIPSCILLMSFTYQKARQAPAWQIVPLIVFSIIFAILQNVDIYHLVPLKVTGIRYEDGLSFSQLSLNFIYYIYSFFIHIVVIVSLIIFYSQWRSCTQALKPQIVLIMLGTTSTWICYLFFLSGWGINGLDAASFGYGFSAVAFAVGIYRYQFIDLIPIARTHIFDQLNDAYLIIDNSRRVIDYNLTAKNLFPDIEITTNIGSIYEIYDFIGNDGNDGNDWPKLIHLDNQHWYEISQQSILDKNDHLSGSIIRFMDVTERELLLARLRKQAETDDLTGFSCRSHILQQMHELTNASRQNNSTISAALLEIASLEKIYEEQGSAIADIRIQQLARTVKGMLAEDVVIGRLGGGQFLLLFPSQTEERVEILLEEIITKCEKQLLMNLRSATAELKLNEQYKSLLQRLSVALMYSSG